MKPEVFCGDIYIEYNDARKHHAPMHSFHEGYAIILEEVRELETAIFNDNPHQDVQRELIQLGAMCMAFANELLPEE